MRLFIQFTRFTGVGVIGTAAQYAVLITFVRMGRIDPVWASSFGAVVGALVNYYLNYRYTFRSSIGHGEAMLKFFAVAGIGLTLNLLVMSILARHLGLHYLLSQLLATGLVLLWNFAGNRFWTFRDPTNAPQR